MSDPLLAGMYSKAEQGYIFYVSRGVGKTIEDWLVSEDMFGVYVTWDRPRPGWHDELDQEVDVVVIRDEDLALRCKLQFSEHILGERLPPSKP